MDSLEKAFLNNKDFQPHISSITFFNYKNIENGSTLNFNFPLTLLIGKNGTNKSSMLHALYGCPKNKSTGEYWFGTKLDPIKKDLDNKPAFVYRYNLPKTSIQAEVVKTIIKRINSKDSTLSDPDYWEPSRPLKKYNMTLLKDVEIEDSIKSKWASQTRWNAIKKDVVYLDFRSEISAFDKAFYQDSDSISRPQHRQTLRRQTTPLKKAIKNNETSRIWHLKERIFENYTFNTGQIETVNKILGSNFSSITYIEHDFFLTKGFSVYLKKENSYQYSEAFAGSGETSVIRSEAFAGSGETSVIRLVYALENAKEQSLVLFDEPETSLHIGAQYKLQEYILQKIKEKFLQVIMSTHSPFFAKGLPDNAIKILYANQSSQKKIQIVNESPADESSFYLGNTKLDSSKKQIFVEDALSKAVVKHVIENHLNPSQRDAIEVNDYPGGAQELINLAQYESVKTFSNCFFILDGDQKPDASNIPPPGSNIPESENPNLKFLIKNWIGQEPKIAQNSGDLNIYERYRSFIDFGLQRFLYFPFDFPEKFIVEESKLLNHIEDKCYKSEIDSYVQSELASSGKVTSEEIFIFQRMELNNIDTNHESYKNIKDVIIHIIRTKIE